MNDKMWFMSTHIVSHQYGRQKMSATVIVLQRSSNKSLSFRDGPTGGTSFVNIYQNVRLDP